MNSREFVRLVKQEAIDGTIQSILNALESPRSVQPSPESEDAIQKSIADFFSAGAREQQRRAAWYRGLTTEDRTTIKEILANCAELSAFSFCTLLDGVGGKYDGAFELSAVDLQGRRSILNPNNADMLHDLLSDVCEEGRERGLG